MNAYRILADVASDADIEAGFEWYESEQPGLALEFLDEIELLTHALLTDSLSTRNFDQASVEP